MSELADLAEIRRILSDIRDATVKTANDVTWIKDDMEKGAVRMDEHDKRIGSVEGRLHWYSGIAAGIGALLGFGGSHLIKP